MACCNYVIEAKQTLDKCVYGHDNAKIQILQLIVQWITNLSAKGSAIAIYLPPGSGKTSLLRDSISKILSTVFFLRVKTLCVEWILVHLYENNKSIFCYQAIRQRKQIHLEPNLFDPFAESTRMLANI